ncbi:MAG: HAMP domain-containing protein [Actinomycetia bacterium]|nr:HAMP domain-containing protein [Actinomycetes bacterium]
MARRILLSLLSLALFVLLVLEIPLALFFSDRERERFTNGVLADASVLAARFEDTLEQNLPPDPTSADSYAADVGARVVVVDDRGISVIDTDAIPPLDFSTRDEVQTALGGRRATGTRFSETLGTELLFVAVPVASGSTIHGAIRVTVPTSDVEARVLTFRLGLILVGAVVLLAVAIVGWTLSRSLTRPLARTAEMARAFGDGDLRPRPGSADDPPEMVALVDSLNAMAGRLRDVLDSQRAFVADASHQLRTPLTALRLQLDNLEAGTDPARRDQLDSARGEISRLSLMVEQLLALARAERQPDLESTDLDSLVADRVGTWLGLAAESQVNLGLDAQYPVGMVALAPGAIEQVLDNLLDNAIAASDPGGEVTVQLAAGDAEVRISVVDHGTGLSDHEKDRALDRFWRGDWRRPGTGLGLPIARALVSRHGGHLELSDTDGGGLTISARIPRGPAELPRVGP